MRERRGVQTALLVIVRPAGNRWRSPATPWRTARIDPPARSAARATQPRPIRPEAPVALWCPPPARRNLEADCPAPASGGRFDTSRIARTHEHAGLLPN